MPELKRTFSSGAMNKDLDERLVPNGQYRDALNVQVSTSEGADVGTLQNILGNEIPYSPALSDFYRLGLNAICIGAIRKDDTECIYWFVESDSKSSIVEYNQKQETVTPVLVDTLRVLNFSRDNLITGVEILDDFLIWTDDKTEPKIINITDWKAYTDGNWTHTQVDGGNFEEKHCTVIKPAPKLPPVLNMSNTTRDGAVSGTLIGYSFTFLDADGTWNLVPTGAYTNQDGDDASDSSTGVLPDPVDSQILVSGTAPDFRIGDKLKIRLIDNDGNVNADVSVIVSVLNVYATNPNVFKINIDSINENIEQNVQNWKIELIQTPALFEDKFVRFSYRYKYTDGQYSTIAPYSEVAFIGDAFDYNHSKGYNLGMVNQLRKLEILNWAYDVPYGVEEIDILYKDSVSNNIYVVQTVKSTDSEFTDNTVPSPTGFYEGRLELVSETIYKLIPSNQLLRPYDNVPRRAKALSTAGNRLLFGNYLENYNLEYNGGVVTPEFSVVVKSEKVTSNQPVKSIKSQRTYQIGVVYVDKHGRETPVLTHPSGSVKLNKGYAENSNTISVRLQSYPPDWAVGYKYFIKETSQPYYNLAIDRHYNAEDGNVWVSFSSSDRNKIQDDTYLILKKEHDSDAFVKEQARYKVLAVDNEAPEFIKEEYVSQGVLSAELLGRTTTSIFGSSEGYPVSGNNYIDIKADDWKSMFGGSGTEVSSGKPVHQLDNLSLSLFNTKNKTKKYEILSVAYVQYSGVDLYRLNMERSLDSEDVSFMGTISEEDTTPTLSIEIFQKKTKIKPEYYGRFFTKLQRDAVLEESIMASSTSSTSLKTTASTPTFSFGDNIQPSRDIWLAPFRGYTGEPLGFGWFWCGLLYHKTLSTTGPLRFVHSLFTQNGNERPHNTYGWGAKEKNNYVEIAFHGFGKDVTGTENIIEEYDKFATNAGDEYFFEYNTLVSKLTRIGTRFRFADDPDKENNTYTITNWAKSYMVAFTDSSRAKKEGELPQQRVIKFTLKLDKKIVWAPESNSFNYSSGQLRTTEPSKTNIEIVETFYDEESGEFTENPAVFETEPKEVAELDIYYETGRTYSCVAGVDNEHGLINDIDYSNCYSFGNGVESDRIRDDFNAPIIGKGVKASSVTEEQYKEVRKKSDIIYSGIYNATSGVNRLNQFIQAEKITKSINPAYGSIQLMQFRLGDLDVYLEDNVVKIFSDKDALFNADGSINVVSSSKVLGAVRPYAGDYGISKNPESYSRYGNRAYFSDKNRGVILRLSGNGLEPISRYGLEDYFRDKLSEAEQVIGSYDENKNEYNLTVKKLENAAQYNDTVAFREDTNSWTSRKSFIQEEGLSLNNKYYTFSGGDLWSHDNETRNNFYGVQYNSSVKFIFNEAPGSIKSFKTLNYEGSQARVFVDNPDTDNKFENRAAKSGWWVDSIESDLQSGQVKTFKNKEGKWFYNILGTETTPTNLDTREYSVQGLGLVTAASGVGGTEIKLRVE